MEFPTIDILAKDVAEKALDGFIYEGKTLREWVEIIVKQQPCKNYIGKEALIDELKLGYFNKELQEGKNDPCVIDAMIDWAIRTVKRQPPVTPQPFINKPCVSEGACREDKIQVLDKIRAEIAEYGSICVTYAITDKTKTDEGIDELVTDVLLQAKRQVLDIIDKYKESEGEE